MAMMKAMSREREREEHMLDILLNMCDGYSELNTESILKNKAGDFYIFLIVNKSHEKTQK